MKNALIVFLVIIVFFALGTVGYQLAARVDLAPTPGVEKVGGGEQHNLVIIQVDQLDSPQPKLISVWYVSLFFMDGNSPTLGLGQLYPTRSNKKINQSIARSFDLNGKGEPSTGFWRTLETYKIKWEGYLLVDNVTAQRILEWVNGPGDYVTLLASGTDESAERNQLAGQTCSKAAGIDQRGGTPLQWGDLVPAHFRSNLRMEDALAYWNRVTTASNARCDVLPAR